MSDGGIFVYTLAVELARRLAAIVVVAGSMFHGLLGVPEVQLPAMDLHGRNDSVVPGGHLAFDRGIC